MDNVHIYLGGNRMPYRNKCHHYYGEFEEEIVLLEAIVIDQKWIDCGHVDTPLDIQDLFETNLKLKRNYPTSVNQTSYKFFDFV